MFYKEGANEKISYERRDYMAVTGKQQFNAARTKTSRPVLRNG